MWITIVYDKAVFVLIFFTYLPKSQIIYLFKQILLSFSLVRIQFYMSLASGKWVSAKTFMTALLCIGHKNSRQVLSHPCITGIIDIHHNLKKVGPTCIFIPVDSLGTNVIFFHKFPYLKFSSH